MTTPPAGPADLLRHAVASDPGRPRITVYDDTDSPTHGERIELSARVLANWVAKAANLLQDDLDVGPGSVVVLDLPPHWRTLYWALAVWSVGGCVEVPAHRTGGGTTADAGHTADAAHTADAGHTPDTGAPPDAGAATAATRGDVLVTDDPAAAGGTPLPTVLVTLAALARSAPGPVAPGVVDEARELATHGDAFEALDEPADDDPALRADGAAAAYGSVAPVGGTADRVHTATTDTATFLRLLLGALAGDGSVVLTRGQPPPEVLEARLASEGVSAASGPRRPST